MSYLSCTGCLELKLYCCICLFVIVFLSLYFCHCLCIMQVAISLHFLLIVILSIFSYNNFLYKSDIFMLSQSLNLLQLRNVPLQWPIRLPGWFRSCKISFCSVMQNVSWFKSNQNHWLLQISSKIIGWFNIHLKYWHLILLASKVGLPAMSGSSGVVMVVVPSVLGFVTWSPPLDSVGQ